MVLTDNNSLGSIRGGPLDVRHDSVGYGKEQRFPGSTRADGKLLSNPFEVLYDPNVVQTSYHGSSLQEQTPTPTDEVDRNGRLGHNRRTTTEQIVTMISSTDSIKRTGSIVSRSATLRNRNRLKKRNKMMHKNEFVEEDVKSPRLSRRWYMFPVKRKTSLKHNPRYNPLKTSIPKFRNSDELQLFFETTNGSGLATEMVPRNMQLFKYTKLMLPKPRLHSQMALFSTTRNNSFRLEQKTPALKNLISGPLTDTFTKNGENYGASNGVKNVPEFASEAYTRYRMCVFANKLNTLPSFHQVFPEEANLKVISDPEVETINRNLAFEVLLRRTIVAKMLYRLKKNGYFERMQELHDASPSSSERKNKVPLLTKCRTNSINESIDTDALLQRNESLYSGILPSPQISRASHSKGLGFGILESYNETQNTPLQKSTLEYFKSSSSLYSTPRTTKGKENYMLEKFNYKESPTLLYMIDLKEPTSVRAGSQTAQTRPVNLSPLTTLNPDNEIIHTTPELAFGPIMSIPEPEISNHSPNSLNSKSKRKSQTSSNSAILQHLDNLSSELSSFVEDANSNIPGIRMPSVTSIKKAQDSLIQSMEHSNNSFDFKSTPSPQPIHRKTPSNPMAEIRSLTASISIIGSSSDSASLSSSNLLKLNSRGSNFDSSKKQHISYLKSKNLTT